MSDFDSLSGGYGCLTRSEETIMAESKKRALKTNPVPTQRPQAEAPRDRFLYTDVTDAEYKKIREYCKKKNISLSQFLADLVLSDAEKPKPQRQDKVKVTLELELTPEQHDKLELLTRLHDKESLDEFVQDVLEPSLKLQRLHSPLKTKMLRFYLSREEHEKVLSHIEGTGISARNYAAMLAVREIRKEKKDK